MKRISVQASESERASMMPVIESPPECFPQPFGREGMDGGRVVRSGSGEVASFCTGSSVGFVSMHCVIWSRRVTRERQERA